MTTAEIVSRFREAGSVENFESSDAVWRFSQMRRRPWNSTLRPALHGAGYEIVKRSLDIAISLTAILVLSPLLIVACAAIWLYDRGPVFFVQKRVGKGGMVFRCFKFRSMVVNAEAMHRQMMEQNRHSDPRTFKMADDPRVTPAGRFIRRFSIDELPQIFNVLMGHMSIVGPRPPMPCEVELYSGSDFRRLSVKPGLTCIWQVSGRARIPFPEQVEMDVEYIRTRSVLTDIRLILKTVPAVLTGDGTS